MDMPKITRCTRASFGALLIALLCAFTIKPSREVSLMFRVPTYQVGGVGLRTTSVAIGDFDGDGRSDIAVVASFPPPGEVITVTRDTVSVLLGRNDGTFGPPIPLPPGVRPQAIVVGDFNGDGHQDLALSNAPVNDCLPYPTCPPPPNGYVSILLGAGDGTFGSPKQFGVGEAPVSMAIGDFNRDGHEDLVVADGVLLGLGDGTFGAEARLTVGDGPDSVAVGDFDGDGYQDLVVANGGSADVSVLLGRGDGTFSSETRFPTGEAPRSVAIGDFNGDGRTDLAVTNIYSDDVSILLGQGDGTFATQVRYGAGKEPVAVVAGDFNGDEHLDLAVADEGSGEISVLLGGGDGTFGSPISCGAGSGPSSIATGQFNGDERLDLAVSNLGGVVFALLGQGNGSFMASSRYEAGASPVSLAIDDFDGDGRQDLAVANRDSNDVSILLGRGEGSFGPEVRFGASGSGSPQSVAVGDFNSDGRQDLVVAVITDTICLGCSGAVSILLGRGDGSFGPAVQFGIGGTPVFAAVGDFNNDGRQDLAVANIRGLGPAGVSILLGRGDGTFTPETYYQADSGSRSTVVGDFNGDGRSDLAVANNFTDTVTVLMGHGDGTFGPQSTFAVGREPRGLAIGDFNGDGREDLAVTVTDPDGVSVLLGQGDGTFVARASYGTGGAPGSIAVGDLNRDGWQDMVVGNGSSQLSILLGRGDGTFGRQVSFLAGAGSVAIGNFNGDQRPDIAVVDGSAQNVSVLLNQATSQAASAIALDVRAVQVLGNVKISFRTDTQVQLAAINIMAEKKSSLVKIISMAPKVGIAGASYVVSIPRRAFKGSKSIVVQTVMADGTIFNSAVARF
ncbi:MAG TPA: VCBS repeat-containing protein [Candidatus Polarisedimenticolia bacterium]|nr:VCBS repeat-containing protein [Candidatus Polarisedimenticolia bacterium]